MANATEMSRHSAEDLREELDELKATIRAMQKEIKSPFDELVETAIGILARQYIRQIEPWATPESESKP